MQMAPLIDIVFLLLIFFILTWNYDKAEKELEVSVPTAQEGAETDRKPYELIINVLADRSVRIESVTVTLPQLLERLAPIAEVAPNQPVRIRGDGRVDYQAVVDVINTCRAAGISNVAFATQSPSPE